MYRNPKRGTRPTLETHAKISLKLFIYERAKWKKRTKAKIRREKGQNQKKSKRRQRRRGRKEKQKMKQPYRTSLWACPRVMQVTFSVVTIKRERGPALLLAKPSPVTGTPSSALIGIRESDDGSVP